MMTSSRGLDQTTRTSGEGLAQRAKARAEEMTAPGLQARARAGARDSCVDKRALEKAFACEDLVAKVNPEAKAVRDFRAPMEAPTTEFAGPLANADRAARACKKAWQGWLVALRLPETMWAATAQVVLAERATIAPWEGVATLTGSLMRTRG